MCKRRTVTPLTTLILIGTAALVAIAAGTPAERCASTKIKAAGTTASCLLGLDARAARGMSIDPGTVQRCKDKLGDPVRGAFAHAETRGGCLTSGDAPAIESKVDAFVDDVYAALNVDTPNDCQSAKLS